MPLPGARTRSDQYVHRDRLDQRRSRSRSRSRSRDRYHHEQPLSTAPASSSAQYTGAQYTDDNLEAKLYVGNLSLETQERDLYTKFVKYGPVRKYEVIRDRVSGISRGFGFVKFQEAGDAVKAFEALQGDELLGRPMKLDRCVGKSPRGLPDGRPRGPLPLPVSSNRPRDSDRDVYRRSSPPPSRYDYDVPPARYDYDYGAPQGYDSYSNGAPPSYYPAPSYGSFNGRDPYDDGRAPMPSGYYPPHSDPYERQRPLAPSEYRSSDYRQQAMGEPPFRDDRRFRTSGRDEPARGVDRMPDHTSFGGSNLPSGGQRRQPYPCRDFAHKGGCKFGSSCKFSHEIGNGDSR